MSYPKQRKDAVLKKCYRLITSPLQYWLRKKAIIFLGRYAMDSKLFFETIGNVNQEVIRAYVQEKFNVMNKKKHLHNNLGCFKTRLLRAELSKYKG